MSPNRRHSSPHGFLATRADGAEKGIRHDAVAIISEQLDEGPLGDEFSHARTSLR